jgi:thymidylate synthase ThyX
MSYLEQSTRYIAYDSRLGGRYRYYRDPEVLSSALGARYISDMDRLFENYAEMVPLMANHFRTVAPKADSDSDFVYRQAVAAKAFDSVRGMLPAASLSNVGIYASGQAYEALLIRMRAHVLPEARSYAELMLAELRKVIPSFLKRVDLPDRGEATGAYGADCRDRLADVAEGLFPDREVPDAGPLVDLTDFDPDAEVKLVAAALYPFTNQSDRFVEERVRTMTVDERLSVLRALVGDRSNRRHRPGRALERPSYRFDILSDYGAFRDLQRHRMLTLDWQRLSTSHGFVRPPEVGDAGFADRFDASMERSAALHDALEPALPDQAPYAAALAYRVRYMMHMNAREAMHVLELRTSPQGHPAYRRVCQEMHTLIRDVAGHRAIAEMMSYVDHSSGSDLERLDSERRSEQKRVMTMDGSDSSIT